MNDKEFTRDLFNLYVRQRKQLDESVPKDVKEKYIKKVEKYEEQKEKQKQRYYENKEKLGSEYLEKLREKNKLYVEKRKQKEKEKPYSPPSSPIRRYAQSSVGESVRDDIVSDDDEDLESVFSEVSDVPQPRKNVFNNFIGF